MDDLLDLGRSVFSETFRAATRASAIDAALRAVIEAERKACAEIAKAEVTMNREACARVSCAGREGVASHRESVSDTAAKASARAFSPRCVTGRFRRRAAGRSSLVGH